MGYANGIATLEFSAELTGVKGESRATRYSNEQSITLVSYAQRAAGRGHACSVRGSGSVEERQCGGPKEVMTFRLNEAGSTLKVWIEPAYRDKQLRLPKEPTLSYSIILGPSSTVRIVDPVVVVLSPDNTELSQYRFKTLHAPGFKSIPATTELRHDPRGPNSSNPRLSVLDNHYTALVLLNNLPERFQVRYPAMQVDGVHHDGPIVSYAVSENTFLLHRCLTGT